MQIRRQEPADPELRQQLSDLLRADRTPEEWQRELESLDPHSIEIAKCQVPSSLNCHLYALGPIEGSSLTTSMEALNAEGIAPWLSVIRELIDCQFLECIKEPEVGSVAVYSYMVRLPHSATVRCLDPLLVYSKWGPGRPVFSHPPNECPRDYGEVVRYFKRPDPTNALQAIQEALEKIKKGDITPIRWSDLFLSRECP